MVHKIHLTQKEINARAVKKYAAEMHLMVNFWVFFCVRTKGLKEKAVQKSPLWRAEQLVESAP